MAPERSPTREQYLDAGKCWSPCGARCPCRATTPPHSLPTRLTHSEHLRAPGADLWRRLRVHRPPPGQVPRHSLGRGGAVGPKPAIGTHRPLSPSTLCRTPDTVCSTPSTLCSTPSMLCSIPSTLCSTPNTLCSTPSILDRWRPSTIHPWPAPTAASERSPRMPHPSRKAT